MTSNIYYVALRVVTCCVVFAFFLFAPFRTRFRYCYFKTAMLASLLTVITVGVTIFFLTPGMFYVAYSTLGIILWLICAVIIFFIAIKGSSFEILFIVLVLLNLYVNIAAISKVILDVVSPFESNHLTYTLIRIGILIAYIPLIWILLGKLYRQVIESNINFSFWQFIWTIPALTYMIFFIKIRNEYWKGSFVTGIGDIVFIVLWSFTTYAFFGVTLLMLIQTYKGITALQQTEIVETQLTMQRNQYEQLLENFENTARLRHDWRHHLLSISGLIKNGKLEELQSYIETLTPEYSISENSSVCLNHIADIILQHYAVIAKTHKIAIKIKTDIPKELVIADTDLCIILGNLVKNAVEACLNQENGDKSIEIKAEMKGTKQLAILIKNTYQGELIFRDKIYYSTKHDGVGIGLSSVEKIIKKNHGTMKISCGEKHYKVYALFNVC